MILLMFLEVYGRRQVVIRAGHGTSFCQGTPKCQNVLDVCFVNAKNCQGRIFNFAFFRFSYAFTDSRKAITSESFEYLFPKEW